MAGCNQTATDQSQLAVWLTLAMRIKCFGSACLSRNTRKPKPHFFRSEGLRELTLFLWRSLKMSWDSYRWVYESLSSPPHPPLTPPPTAAVVLIYLLSLLGWPWCLPLCLSIFSTGESILPGPHASITPSTSSQISLMAPYCNCSLNRHLFCQTVSSSKAGSVDTFLTTRPPPPPQSA